MAEQILSHLTNKETLNIIDPAMGDGELLVSLINKLINSNIRNLNIYGFDTNDQSTVITRERLKTLYPNVSLHLITGDFLEFCMRI